MDANPYAEPQVSGEPPTRNRLRMLPPVLAAALLAGVAFKLYKLWEVVQVGRGRKLPPTLYSEHAGIAVALLCIAIIVLIWDTRPRQ